MIITIIVVFIVFGVDSYAFEQAFGASIRTGPVASETSPNWRLCLGVGYENTEFEVFFGADMNISVHTNGLNDRGEDLIKPGRAVLSRRRSRCPNDSKILSPCCDLEIRL